MPLNNEQVNSEHNRFYLSQHNAEYCYPGKPHIPPQPYPFSWKKKKKNFKIQFKRKGL